MIKKIYIICFDRKVYHFVGGFITKNKKIAFPLCNNPGAHGTDHSEPRLQTYVGGSPQGKIINYIPKGRRLCQSCARKLAKKE